MYLPPDTRTYFILSVLLDLMVPVLAYAKGKEGKKEFPPRDSFCMAVGPE